MPSSCPLYTRKGKHASYGIDAWYRIQFQAHIETHPTISPKECYEWFESTEYYSYSYFEKNFAKIKRGIQPERALKVQNGRKSTTSYEGNKEYIEYKMNCRQEALRMSLNHVVPVEPNVASNTTVFVQQLWQQLLGHNYVAPALSKKPFYLPSPNKKQCVREERSDMCSLHPRMDIDISAIPPMISMPLPSPAPCHVPPNMYTPPPRMDIDSQRNIATVTALGLPSLEAMTFDV
eukprot:536492_1